MSVYVCVCVFMGSVIGDGTYGDLKEEICHVVFWLL